MLPLVCYRPLVHDCASGPAQPGPIDRHPDSQFLRLLSEGEARQGVQRQPAFVAEREAAVKPPMQYAQQNFAQLGPNRQVETANVAPPRSDVALIESLNSSGSSVSSFHCRCRGAIYPDQTRRVGLSFLRHRGPYKA